MSHRRKTKGQEHQESIEERMKALEDRIENIFSLDGTKTEITNIQFMMGLMKGYVVRNEYLEQQVELLEQNRQMFVAFIHENKLDDVIEKWFKEKSKPEEPPVTPTEVKPLETESIETEELPKEENHIQPVNTGLAGDDNQA